MDFSDDEALEQLSFSYEVHCLGDALLGGNAFDAWFRLAGIITTTGAKHLDAVCGAAQALNALIVRASRSAQADGVGHACALSLTGRPSVSAPT